MSLHFAHGRSTLYNNDWSIATSSGGNLETQNLYFSLQAANQVGKNLIIKSSLVNISSGNKLTFTINSSALRSGEGWTHYVIGVSTTDDVTTFEQIAKIPIYALDSYNNIDFDAPDAFPLTLEITEQEQLTTGEFVDVLPTTDLVDGMIRGFNDDDLIYEYDAVIGEWKEVEGFSTYILDTFYDGGCAVDISNVNNFDLIKTLTYVPDGTNSAKIRYFLKNDSGFEIPAGTSIKLLVDVDGYDKSKLFENKIFYTIKGFSLEEECLLRTTYLESGQPLDFIDFEQTHSAAFPTLNLKDKVRVGESVFIELYINVHEQEFAGQLAQGNISIIPQFVKSVATYNPVGSLFEKGIIYGSYGKKRVTPGVGLSANVREGEGLVKKYFFFQPSSILSSLTANTANQKVYINRSGITYIDTQERDDTLLRAIIDTTTKESHVGEWSIYRAVSANDSLYLTVNYPCDADLVATVRSDYPDVLANDDVYFNVKKINFYVQRLSDGEIRKFTNNLVAAGEPQNFTLANWSSGVVVGSTPTTKASFFNPSTVDFIALDSVGSFTSGSYRVCYSFVYEGDVVSDISHSVALGCIKEAEKDLADVATTNGYASIEQVKALTNVNNGNRVYVVPTDQTYIYNANNEEDNDDIDVLEPTSGVGRWLNVTRQQANKPNVTTTAPTITDDETLGYVVGDKWLDTVAGDEYTLLDATEGAANWQQVGGNNDSIILSSNVTWYVSPTGNVNNDGLTVGTPITLEEAASRVFKIVPTDTNYLISIELANGNYNYANGYTFVHPDTEFMFDVKLHGQDWVGLSAYPTAIVNDLKFIGFSNYSYVENIYYATLRLVGSSADVKNVATTNICRITEYYGYAYVNGVYKFGGVGEYAFSVTGGYLDFDGVTFDAGGTTRNFTQCFIRIGYAGGINLSSPNTIVGTFTGKKIDFINAEAILDGDEANFATIPGNISPVYPTYIFAPSNTLATTASLGTAAALDVNEPNGVCGLDGSGKVSATYLPSYVDDVLEYANLAGFPVTGETGKIYVALNNNKVYRWSGSVYVEISNPFSGSYNDLADKPTIPTTAAGITVDTTNLNVNLSGTDNTVQKAIETLDELVAGGGGHTIQDEGTPLTQRANLNFVGTGVTATDNAGTDATTVTVNLPSTGSGLNLGAWDSSGTFTSGVRLDGSGDKVILPAADTATRTASTPLQGELIYDTDLDKFFYGDGVTVGGVEIGISSGGGTVNNLIINGRFDVWQLGTSFPSVSNLAVTADRWMFGQIAGSAAWTIQRSTDVPNVNQRYSLETICTTADTTLGTDEESHVRYGIEGIDFIQLVGKTATLHFWVKSNLTGTFCVAFTNSARDRTYIAEYTINTANTWEEKTITLTFNYSGGTWNYTNELGLGIRFAFRAGSTYQGIANTWNNGNFVGTANQSNLANNVNNYLRVSGVSLNEGNSYIPPSIENFADVLQKCRRYLTVYGCTTNGINAAIGFGGGTPDAMNFDIPLPVQMRVAPNVTLIGAIGVDYDIQTLAGTLLGITSTTSIARSPDYIKFTANKTNAFVSGTPYNLRFITTSAKLVANSEL